MENKEVKLDKNFAAEMAKKADCVNYETAKNIVHNAMGKIVKDCIQASSLGEYSVALRSSSTEYNKLYATPDRIRQHIEPILKEETSKLGLILTKTSDGTFSSDYFVVKAR